MKRNAVLFGIMALVVVCGTAFATAPQVRDMPDLRLSSGDGASGLPLTGVEAYDAMDFYLDVDDAPTPNDPGRRCRPECLSGRCQLRD